MKTTTPEQFEKFKKYFTEYQNLFGLNNYNIVFKLVKLKYAWASILPDEEGYFATVKLTEDIKPNEKTDEDLKKFALHEVVHLLTDRLAWIGLCRFIDDNEIKCEVESLTVRLTNIITNLEKK